MSAAAHSEPIALDRRSLRRGFERVSAGFDRAAWLHDEVRGRLFERLDPLLIRPARILDLGSATGRGTLEIAARFPTAGVLALDSSPGMCTQAAQACRALPQIRVGVADAHALPLTAASLELVVANLVLLWCDPVQFMAECARVLRPGGVLTFSTFGPDTLIELRRAWAAVDDRVHVQPLVDMHDLGDLLVAAGFADPVVDVERLTVTYPAPQALFAELRAAGAANAWPTRRKTLMGRARWEGFLAALAGSVRDGRWPVSLELIFGHAWRRPESRPDPAGAEFAFPLERLARRSPSA